MSGRTGSAMIVRVQQNIQHLSRSGRDRDSVIEVAPILEYIAQTAKGLKSLDVKYGTGHFSTTGFPLLDENVSAPCASVAIRT